MHPIQTLLGHIAAGLAVVQVIPYVWSILKGKTKPSRTSYGIWTAIDLVAVSSYFASGATTTRWLFVVLTVNSLVIFLLSLKYGMGGFTKLDIVCSVLALLALAAWTSTNEPELARYITLAAGTLGYLPTIRKAYHSPKTENTLSWSIYVVTALINACALTTLRPVIALPVFVALVLSSVVTLLLVFPKWKIPNMQHRSRTVI